VRWDDLFTDLEAQAEALEVAARAAEVGERTRVEVSGLAVHDRLRAAVGTSVRIRLAGGLPIVGTVQRVGPDWLLLDEGAGRECVLSTAAVRSVSGLGRLSAVPGSEGVVESRLALRSALRGIARDRSAVRVHLVDGDVLDATVDRVGVDFVEIARHAAGEPRRHGEVREVVLVPFGALAAVRRTVG
jgi:hypothetical protein